MILPGRRLVIPGPCITLTKELRNEDDMRAKTAEGQRLEAIARERVSRQSNELLATAWLLTETQPMSEELAVTRGWLIDEMETRMGPERFDAWLWTDGDAVDPLPFMAG